MQYQATHVLLYLDNVALLPAVGRGAGMLEHARNRLHWQRAVDRGRGPSQLKRFACSLAINHASQQKTKVYRLLLESECRGIK
jgi:hypothetical protein